MSQIDDLGETITQLVRERFPEEAIDHVIVKQATDMDGEPILEVLVIYKAKPDVSKIKSLARNIWTRIDTAGGFPVLSFRSTAEHNRLARAVA
jgi:hypothetical protein